MIIISKTWSILGHSCSKNMMNMSVSTPRHRHSFVSASVKDGYPMCDQSRKDGSRSTNAKVRMQKNKKVHMRKSAFLKFNCIDACYCATEYARFKDLI